MATEGATEKKRQRGDKTSLHELEIRYDIVEKMMIDGYPSGVITRQLEAERGWARTTTYRYMDEIRKRWLIDREAERSTDAERTIARLTDLAFELRDEKAWSPLMQCEKLMADVRGVAAPQKHDHRVAVAVVPQQTDYEQLTGALTEQQVAALKEIALAVTLQPVAGGVPALPPHAENPAPGLSGALDDASDDD